MGKFNGTKGKCHIEKRRDTLLEIRSNCRVKIIAECENYDRNKQTMSILECEANAELIQEAFNTVNECGLTPSELLKQRNELIEALTQLLAEADDLYTHVIDQNFIDSEDEPAELMEKAILKAREIILKVSE
jgi:hypothetical protein